MTVEVILTYAGCGKRQDHYQSLLNSVKSLEHKTSVTNTFSSIENKSIETRPFDIVNALKSVNKGMWS